MLLLQGWNYLWTFFPFWMQSTRVWRATIQCQGVWQGFSFGRGSTEVESWWAASPCSVSSLYVPQVLYHCHANVPIAVLTQQPFTELTAVPSLIRVWEVFLSSDKKTYLWFAGQSFGLYAVRIRMILPFPPQPKSPAPKPHASKVRVTGFPSRKVWPSAPLTDSSGRKQQRKGF